MKYPPTNLHKAQFTSLALVSHGTNFHAQEGGGLPFIVEFQVTCAPTLWNASIRPRIRRGCWLVTHQFSAILKPEAAAMSILCPIIFGR